jgi:hypothetical protein
LLDALLPLPSLTDLHLLRHELLDTVYSLSSIKFTPLSNSMSYIGTWIVEHPPHDDHEENERNK